MSHFSIHLPVTVRFGTDALNALAERPSLPPGDRALILARASGDCFADGSLDLVQGQLSAAGVGSMLMDAVGRPALAPVAQQAADRAREKECAFLVALGGAGTACAAKRAAHLAGLPLVVVCADAPCGAELDQWSLLAESDRARPGPGSPFPSLVVVDPALTNRGHDRSAALAGLGALARAVQAHSSTAATPFSDILALEAASLAARTLSSPVLDADARARLAWAGVLAGLALGLSHPGPALALAASLAARDQATDMHAALALLAPAALAVSPPAPDRMLALAEAMGMEEDAPQALEHLAREILFRYQIPSPLPDEAIRSQAAEYAVEDCNDFFAKAPGRPETAEARAMIARALGENNHP